MESAINALGVHGMDKCFDRRVAGLKWYAALAVVGRNIHQMRTFQLKKELKSEKRKKISLDWGRFYWIEAIHKDSYVKKTKNSPESLRGEKKISLKK